MPYKTKKKDADNPKNKDADNPKNKDADNPKKKDADYPFPTLKVVLLRTICASAFVVFKDVLSFISWLTFCHLLVMKRVLRSALSS